MLKYLRIAVTALSLTACVLMIALWVRSYWWYESLIWGTRTNPEFAMASHDGVAYFSHMRVYETDIPLEWYVVRWRSSDLVGVDEGIFPLPALSFTSWNEPFVAIPYWLLVPFSMGFAALLCLPWSRRFSLRTLLIATTLVALGLGAVIYLSG